MKNLMMRVMPKMRAAVTWGRRASAMLAMAASLLMWGEMPAMAQEGETTTYKDWVVRCVPRDGLPPCDMVQSVFNADNNQRLLQMSVAHLGRDEKVGVQVWTPTGVLVSSGALFEIDGETRALEALKFTRCETDGCLVEAIVEESAIKPLRAGNKGAFAVLASDGQPRVIAVSLAGFSAAMKDVSTKNKAWFDANN